jgi:RNA polymerase sigma-70 factor (ECF subfamily)
MSDGTALSWGEVFDEHAPAIASYARARGVRDPEDLVQDVFVAAVKQLHGFVGDRSGLRSLLFTIAYRRIADHHRRSYRRPETLVAEHTPRPDPGPTVEQVVDLGESANRAMQAFVVLSDRERRVIEMRLIEEASPASVGRALGLSSGNVRVIQSRALVKIRKHLRSMGEGGFAQPLVTVASLPDFVRYLRTKVPADRLLGQWVEELRSKGFEPTREGSAGGVAMAPSSVAATWATDGAYSLLSAVTSSGAARIGALVSVVALSATPLLPSFIPAESSPLLDEAIPATEAQVAEPTPPLKIADDVSGGVSETPTDRVTTDPPSSVRSVVIESPLLPSRPDSEAARDPGLPEVERPEPPAVTVPGLVEDVVEPLVRDTVEVLVDDVVEPGADLVEVVVESTVEVVDELVVDRVDELVGPLADEVVPPLVDDLTDTVDSVVSGLGGLLGGH